ncbi:MAG: N-acetyltransferase [Dehalococcoidia bacterium]|nr:MAG: N-acetyltransferase [Dehalococcoidia bacterium]
MTRSPAVQVRSARPEDSPAIVQLILELAEYEQLRHHAQPDAERLREHLFGPQPFAEALVAEAEGGIIGYALFFPTYSTFRTQPGLYLEDLYVQPAYRRRGIGTALIASVAACAVARGCTRLEWSVLTWNASAIRFYEQLGAEPLREWQTHRLSGADLARLAARAPTR